jgi:hypothetical protein
VALFTSTAAKATAVIIMAKKATNFLNIKNSSVVKE